MKANVLRNKKYNFSVYYHWNLVYLRHFVTPLIIVYIKSLSLWEVPGIIWKVLNWREIVWNQVSWIFQTNAFVDYNSIRIYFTAFNLAYHSWHGFTKMVPVEILPNYGNYFLTLQLGLWTVFSGIVLLYY